MDERVVYEVGEKALEILVGEKGYDKQEVLNAMHRWIHVCLAKEMPDGR